LSAPAAPPRPEPEIATTHRVEISGDRVVKTFRSWDRGEPTPVFGINDGNLANFLWDAGTGTVHVIDFESAGRNDRAFELADSAEHISLWLRAGTGADAILGRLDLTDLERTRIRAYRPAFAAFWLLRLLPGGPSARRNPPGTLEAQAARFLEFR